MTSLQGFLDELTASNRELAQDIDSFANSQQQQPDGSQKSEEASAEARITAFLDQLYTAIYAFELRRSHPRTTNKAVLAAWTSFFLPIQSLTRLSPHGYFLAARVTLYVTMAVIFEDALYRKFPETPSSILKVAELHFFLSSLDEQLLSCLRSIWRSRKSREEFSWVFSEHRLSSMPEDRLIAVATSPADLAARWRSQKDPNAAANWQPDDDGPIRGVFRYTVVDRDNGKEDSRGRDVLRRSRQFIFDARQVAQPVLARDRRQIAEHILDASPLALETKYQILSYLEVPVFDKYLSHLDLADVYSSFPDVDTRCSECTGRKSTTKADRAKKQTCLTVSLTVWNLALRVFHTFHRRSKSEAWLLCGHVGCQGHHDDFDLVMAGGEHQLRDMLETIVRARCGPGATLQSIGLGPAEEITLSSEEADKERRALLFGTPWYWRDGRDAEDDRKMKGGIAGIVNVMLLGKTLLGSWEGENSAGSSTTSPSWSFGRTRVDERNCQRALCEIYV